MIYSKTPLKGKTVSDLDFLTGRWRNDTGDDLVEEYWLPEMHANKAGVFRWIKEGEVYIYEIFAITEQDGEIHMMLRHFDKRFKAFEEKDSPLDFVVTELSKNEVVFIDTAKPDGGFLRYNTSKKDTLEFFSYKGDGTAQFSLSFKKAH